MGDSCAKRPSTRCAAILSLYHSPLPPLNPLSGVCSPPGLQAQAKTRSGLFAREADINPLSRVALTSPPTSSLQHLYLLKAQISASMLVLPAHHQLLTAQISAAKQFTSSSGTDKCPTLAGTHPAPHLLKAHTCAFTALILSVQIARLSVHWLPVPLHPLNRANCARSGHQPAAPRRRSLHPFYTTRPPSVLYTIYHELSFKHDMHAPSQKTCRRV